MACSGCKEEKRRMTSERQALDGRIMAALSEVIGEVRQSNPELARRLMALNGDINAQAMDERKTAEVPE